MTEHTPGPWTIEHYGDGDSLVIHSDSNTRICFMATPGSSPRAFSKIEANGRLIAAAPEMHEALGAAENELEWQLERGNGNDVTRAALRIVKAARAKAEAPSQDAA